MDCREFNKIVHRIYDFALRGSAVCFFGRSIVVPTNHIHIPEKVQFEVHITFIL
jgi:hypothetical protein